MSTTADSHLWSPKCQIGQILSTFQATAVWQWWRCLCSHIPCGKKVLRLNLDETAVRFFYKPSKGLRTRRTPNHIIHETRAVQHATKGQQRRALTHVAIICDDSELQPQIPQFILGAEHVLRVRDMDCIAATLSPNVHLWRRKSGWINKAVMKDILTTLGNAVAPLLAHCQPILVMDAHKAHFATDVLRWAAKQHIWICIVPASMTFLLQPLDTDVFSRYKAFLRRRYAEFLSDQPSGELSAASVILAMNEACRYVLQAHAWESVFSKTDSTWASWRSERQLCRSCSGRSALQLPRHCQRWHSSQRVFRSMWMFQFQSCL